jgi:hypothetical protein
MQSDDLLLDPDYARTKSQQLGAELQAQAIANLTPADSISFSSSGSVADSKAESAAGRASTADSKALSVSTNASTADSKAVSGGTSASIANSRLTSAGF